MVDVGRVGRRPVLAGRSVKPDLTCCNPRSIHVPSGIGWYHEKTCRVAPDTRVGEHPGRLRHLIEPAGYADAHIDDDDDRLPTFQEAFGA